MMRASDGTFNDPVGRCYEHVLTFHRGIPQTVDDPNVPKECRPSPLVARRHRVQISLVIDDDWLARRQDRRGLTERQSREGTGHEAANDGGGEKWVDWAMHAGVSGKWARQSNDC